MAVRLKFALQFGKIVNFPIENYPDGLILVRHRLMATGKVNNGQSAETKSQWSGKKVTFIIRTTVDDGSGHSLDVGPLHGRTISKIELSAYSAHGIDLLRYCSIFCDLRLLHALRFIGCLVFCEQKAQTPEHLRLRPSVHRHIIPPDEEFASPERPVRFLPALQRVT